MKKNNNQTKIIVTFAAILCFMAIGYAALSQQLKINGTAKITGNWNIQFTNIVSNPSGGASNKVAPTGIGTTTATFQVNLNEPGDKMVYDITVSNLGNIDAIVDSVTEIDNDNQDIKYTIEGIQRGTELKATESKEFKVTVQYDKVVTAINNTSRTISINVNFVQKQGSNIEVAEEDEPTCIVSNAKLAEIGVTPVTEGDGLYASEDEPCRYIYKGTNPDNYITFNNSDWRIISVEPDATLKIVKTDSIATMAWDEENNRDASTSTYCVKTTYQTDYSKGCNAWAATSNLVEIPTDNRDIFTVYAPLGAYYEEFDDNYKKVISGTVTKDSSINKYLNETYYPTIGSDKQYIEKYNFNVGSPAGDSAITNSYYNILQEKLYKWNGYVGLIQATDYMVTSSNSNCVHIWNAITTSLCDQDNWQKTNDSYWTISFLPDTRSNSSSGGNDVWRTPGSNQFGLCNADSGRSYNVKPVVYLKSTVKLNGTGNSGNKFTIKQ